MKVQKRRGFSLVELLLSVAIIAGLASLSAPVTIRYLSYHNLASAEDSAIMALRRAQSLSFYDRNAQPWGVYIQEGEIVVFSGTSYASRESFRDERYAISPGITITGDKEIIFDRLTGEVESLKTVVFSDDFDRSIRIYAHEKGSISSSSTGI